MQYLTATVTREQMEFWLMEEREPLKYAFPKKAAINSE